MTHNWPRNPGSSSRSIGRVIHQECNNCLAMKIEHEWVVNDEIDANGFIIEYHTVTSETIVEDPSGNSKCTG